MKSVLRGLSFAVVTLVCFAVSISLVFRVTLLHFATVSWAFLRIPEFDPRSAEASDELALVLFQLVGGVTFAISSVSENNVRRSLKWSPLFIIAFAALTFMAVLALTFSRPAFSGG